MPRLTGDRLPKYGKHKASGQAVVKLDGRDVYLGLWNFRAGQLEYDRVIGEWLANGRALPAATQLTVVEGGDAPPASALVGCGHRSSLSGS